MRDSPILIGLAVDLSGSMKESIRNDIDEKMSRLKSMRQSLGQFTKEARHLIQRNRQEGKGVAVSVFAYGFGFRLADKNICDLLALSKIDREFYDWEDSSSQTVEMYQSYQDGYAELERIAESYGYERKLVNFAKEHLKQSDAGKLAQELKKDRDAASQLLRLIPKTKVEAAKKFGFQKAVNFTSDKIGFGKVIDDHAEMAKNLVFALIARADSTSVEATRDRIIIETKRRISDQIDKIGDVTLPIEKIADLWERNQIADEDIEQIQEVIYGETPMRHALEIINQRFDRELDKLPPNTRSFLFILSDGEPTDGDPLPLANKLQEMGVTIISCFVTNEDITEPRILFGRLNSDWTDGVKLMFNMASRGEESSQIVQFLKERKWKIYPNAKVFVQVNHSEILEEFLQGLLSLVKSPE